MSGGENYSDPPWKGKLVNSTYFKLDHSLGSISPVTIYEGLVNSFPTDFRNVIALYQLCSRTWCIKFNENTNAEKFYGQSFQIQVKEQERNAVLFLLNPNVPEMSSVTFRVHWVPELTSDNDVIDLVMNKCPQGCQFVEIVSEFYEDEKISHLRNGVRKVKINVPKKLKTSLLSIVGKHQIDNSECLITILGLTQCLSCKKFGHVRRNCPNPKPSYAATAASNINSVPTTSNVANAPNNKNNRTQIHSRKMTPSGPTVVHQTPPIVSNPPRIYSRKQNATQHGQQMPTPQTSATQLLTTTHAPMNDTYVSSNNNTIAQHLSTTYLSSSDALLHKSSLFPNKRKGDDISVTSSAKSSRSDSSISLSTEGETIQELSDFSTGLSSDDEDDTVEQRNTSNASLNTPNATIIHHTLNQQKLQPPTTSI